MGSLKGVDIQRGTLGTNVVGAGDRVCGLLATGVPVAADAGSAILGIDVGQTVKLNSVKDAEAYGITQDYDAVNNVRVHRHISEYFRIAGAGNTLHLMLYTGTPTDAFSESFGKKMIADAKGEIRNLAIAYNPPSDYVPTYINGLEQNVYEAIKSGQEFYDWTYETFRPCQIILEGRGFNATNVLAALDLRSITAGGGVLKAFKVSMCIAQDYDYADSLNDIGKKMADVGTMLGSVARRAVNENIGQVNDGDIMNTLKGNWLVAGLSNHKTIAEFDTELESLDEKGYIFAVSYDGYAGCFWNGDHTCTPIEKDEDGYFNEYTLSYGRVHDKSVRQLRTALLPHIKSTQPVDSETGKLPPALAGYFESVGDDVFEKMEKAREISAGKMTVDSNSDLLIVPRVLKVSFVVVPMGQIDEIKGYINLKTNI